jgi:hypothetical protein
MILNADQQAAVTHIYENQSTYLIGPMGAGKTPVALTAIDELMRDEHIARVLVVAPKRVCTDVWPVEPAKWQLSRLNVAVATGTAAQRVKIFNSCANVVCISFELLPWLFRETRLWQTFDMLIIDELTKLKAGGVGFKALRGKLGHFNVRVGLTGTPVSENFEGLFYQVFAVDDGQSFGRNKSTWLESYFYATDYNNYNWEIQRGMAATLISVFKHLVVSLPGYAHELPGLTDTLVEVDDCRGDEYDDMVRTFIAEGVVADNAAVMTGKLQQLANGFLYDDGDTLNIHYNKQSALQALLSQYSGQPVVVVYQFEAEHDRLLLTPDVHIYTVDELDQWRASSEGVLALHPKSAGHGVDLTHSSVMIFMSPLWSRDLTVQTKARIYRRGQTSACHVYTLIGGDTLDIDIVERVEDKSAHHALLLAHLKN